MTICDQCGVEVSNPRKCPYCHGTYCESHLAPESHDCKHVRKIDLQEYFRVQAGSEIHRAKPSQSKRPSLRKEVILVPILIVILAANFWIWDYRYSEGETRGYQVGHAEGYEKGYDKGNSVGYDSGLDAGFQEGFRIGNVTGYEEGFFIGVYQGNESGYMLGYDVGRNETYDEAYLKGVKDGAGRGYTIRDPTYGEVTQFLQDDKTDQIEYDPDNFTCINFASRLKTNAFNEGFRCFYVNLKYYYNTGHAIVAFNTTDSGFIFIEPQLDEEVIVERGKSYSALNEFEGPEDDVIQDIILTP
jgi:hypothetical protein